jgi:hypothetical protein
MSDITRREFLKRSGAVVAAALVAPEIVPASVLGKSHGHKAPSDKMNIIGVGIGGRGAADLEAMETENIIGLCDVDWDYAGHVFKKYPNAKRYSDWRKMFDEMLKQTDGVMIATADHTHCIIAANAIMAGKHVYLEKPMTLYPYESRLLTKLAKKYKVATQQGNQGASMAGTRQAINWLWNGEIGEVRRVDAFTDRPIWPQGIPAPKEKVAIPSTMNWDCFIGPAKYHDYSPAYTPWNFRGWWDFGSGALGDMANHILQVAYKGLNLGSPTAILGSSTMLMTDSCPAAEKICYRFPERNNMPRMACPPVELTWYDGGLRPELPFDMPAGKKFDSNGVTVYYGTKDTMVVGCYGNAPFLVSGRSPKVPERLRIVRNDNHQQDWIRACKEDPDYRVPSESDFRFAGPLNEIIVLGCAAVRLQGLEQWLNWDSKNMRFTNIPQGKKIKFIKEDLFHVKNGHPTFNRDYSDPVDANEYAKKLIKPIYREGWTLPAMLK